MKTGFYTGRFQPFHLGHLSAIKQAFKEVDKLIIGIGSAQYGHEPENPLTSAERAEIIFKALEENGIPKESYEIIPILDIHDNEAWPDHVHSLVPPFDIVFVGEDGLVKELFELYDEVPVKIVNKEVDINATKIRELISKKEDWEKYLSASTAEYLEKIDFKNRCLNH